MWPNKPFSYIEVDGDENASHFGVKFEGEIRSVVSLFISNNRAQIRKLATQLTYRNRKFATNLIEHCVSYASRKGCRSIWLNARIDKKMFYYSFGFKSTGETFIKGGISFEIMELTIN
jgi:predicted GNAT family N-acyltransferase